MNHEQLLNPEEQKLRRRWLFWSVKMPAVVAGLIILFSIIPLYSQYNLWALLIIFVMTALMGGLTYAPYYCAYKKPGTILLTVTLISIPLLIIMDAIRTAYSFMPANGIELFLLLMGKTLTTSCYVLIFFLSLKLRTINKKVRAMLLTPDKKVSPA